MNTSSGQAGLTEKQEIETTVTNTINQQLQNYWQALAVYEPNALYENCFQLRRVIVELSALAGELDSFWDYISLNLTDDQTQAALTNMQQDISNKLSPQLGDRFYTFVQMCISLHRDFIKNGLSDRISGDPQLCTIGDLMRYFETRSPFLKTTLSLIPHICKGDQQFEFTETLHHLLYPIENYLVDLPAAYFSLIKNEAGITTANDSSSYNELETFFLYPIYMASMDHAAFGMPDYPEIDFQPMPAGQVDSYVNIENTLLKFGLQWEKYAVTECATYKQLQTLIQALKPYCTDDYFITVPLPAFEKLTNHLSQINRLLVLPNSDYDTASLLFTPFIIINGHAQSDVRTFTTFVDLIQVKMLSRNRQFQADTKAAFKSKVIETLEGLGFKQTSLQPISDRECNIAATKNNITYTFYLKNNPVDVIRTSSNYKQTARLNTLRVNHYQKQLTAATAQSPTGKHIVVSRTPVLTPLPGIVNYNALYDFLSNG